MKLKNIRVKNFRTIKDEQSIELPDYLSIVGPNNSGKTNVLRAIQLLFTGTENKYKYDREADFTFATERTNKTSINGTFELEDNQRDNDILELYKDVAKLYEGVTVTNNILNLYLYFSDTNVPTYSFFAGSKRRKEAVSLISQKQKKLLQDILNSFTVIFIPSDKSIENLYRDIVLPQLRKEVSTVLSPYKNIIDNLLNDTSKIVTKHLHDAGLEFLEANLSIPNDEIENVISSFDFLLKDPIETPLSRKGLGIQTAALFAGFLWVNEREKKNNQNVIWLLEEPESYLHPKLAKNHKNLLEKLRRESFVVNTTHSIAFIPQSVTNVIGTELVGNKTTIKKYKTYLECTELLRKSLGVEFSDYFNLGLYNIFVEGPTDREYFEDVLKRFEQIRPDLKFPILRSTETKVLDFGGTSQLEGFLKFSYSYLEKERGIISLFDGDEAGRRAIRNLQSYFGQKQTPFQINRDFVQLDMDKEIENLFPEEWIKAVNVQFPNWFDTYSEGLDGKITVFEIKSDRKSNVRKIFTDRLNQEISPNWSERWATLFEKIEFILASKKKGLVEIPSLNVEEEYPKPAKVTTSVNPSKRDEWFKMYQQLLDYREQFNHINVPRTDKVFVELGKWVSGQRSAYKKGILQSEFVSKLNEIGFDWNFTPTKRGLITWYKRYAELEEFCLKNGHCEVPRSKTKKSTLGNWVAFQRLYYRKGRLSKEQIGKLEELNFKWELPIKGGRPLHSQWEQRYLEVKNYRTLNGHINISQVDPVYKQLGRWLNDQRERRKKGKLLPEREAKLNEIGMIWNLEDARFEQKLSQLKQYFAKYGHYDVSQGDKDFPELGAWVAQIRHRGVLPSRKKRLDEIGFNWKRGESPKSIKS